MATIPVIMALDSRWLTNAGVLRSVDFRVSNAVIAGLLAALKM